MQAAPPQYDYLTTGRHIAFVCTNAAGTTVYPAGLSCLHSVCNPTAFSAAVVRVATSGDWKKAADAEWAASVKWTCDAPPDDQAICADLHDDVIAVAFITMAQAISATLS